VEENRLIAVSRLPPSAEGLLTALDAKTRNMIRKAEKAGLSARELEPRPWIPRFRVLYDETMARNASPGFFAYDDDYYGRMLALPAGEMRLFGTFQGEELVAASIALAHGKGSLYHLGASKKEFSNLGANNLCLFAMSSALIASGIGFLNLGGGRTTDPADPLLRFKRRHRNLPHRAARAGSFRLCGRGRALARHAKRGSRSGQGDFLALNA
jgi:lipid II:glycine glycyltransferase (peptidoglycan interpeptide bridge formation enzyme)